MSAQKGRKCTREEAEETRMCASAKRHWRLLAGWNFRLVHLKGVWGRGREMINKVNFLSFLPLFLFLFLLSVAKIRKAMDDDVCLCKFLSGRTILLSFAFFHLSRPFFRHYARDINGTQLTIFIFSLIGIFYIWRRKNSFFILIYRGFDNRRNRLYNT